MYTRYFDFVVQTLNNFGELLNSHLTFENYLSALFNQLLALVLIAVPIVIAVAVIAIPIVSIKKCTELFKRHSWVKHVEDVNVWNTFISEANVEICNKSSKDISSECVDKYYSLLIRFKVCPVRNAKSDVIKAVRNLCSKYSTYDVLELKVPEFLDNRGNKYNTFSEMSKYYSVAWNLSQLGIISLYLFIVIPVIFMLRY